MLQPLLRPAAVAANDRLHGASPLALPAPPLLDLDFVGRPSLQYPGLPPIAFARNSAATRVNASGLIETVAANAPRFDHHPLTGARLGLLIEDARTNLILRSEDFAHAVWTKDNATAGGAWTAPDGGIGAQALAEDSATGQHRARQNGAAFTAGATLSISCFLKAAGRGFATLQFGAANGFRACFDLTAGTLAPGFAGAAFGTGTFVSAGLQRFPGGWFRCWAVGKEDPAVTAGEAYLNIVRAAAYTDSYAGDGASGILAWGYQVEAGAFPTSYVKTAGATVMRSLDLAKIETLMPWFNEKAGTLFGEGSLYALHPTAGHTYASFSNGTTFERIEIQLSGGGLWLPSFAVIDDGVQVVPFISSSRAAIEFEVIRMVGSYANNDFAFSSRDSAPTIDVVGTLPSVDRMLLGKNEGGGVLRGYLRRVAYWHSRVPNNFLQVLSS